VAASSRGAAWPPDLFSNFRVVDTADDRWEARLRALIKPPGWGATGPAIADDGDNSVPLYAILNDVRRAGCRTIVVEADYVDTNYADEHQAYYARLFRNIPNKCHRLHFFRTALKHSDLPRIQEFGEDYLGNAVVRPIETQRVGPTVLMPTSGNPGGGESCVAARARFTAHIGGAALPVVAMPFVQQDKNVSVCAQAALWMTATHLHEHPSFRIQRCRPSTINALATRHIPLGTLREGLHPMQVQQALQGMGVEALRYVIGEGSVAEGRGSYVDDLRVLSSYVLSGIPVILCINVPKRGGHAVTVIGHDFDFRSGAGATASVLPWITGLIVHDDARGPYSRLPIQAKAKEQRFEGYARAFIVPIPQRVTLRAENVLMHATTLVHGKIINELLEAVMPSGELERASFPSADLRKVVLCPFLIESNEFKRALLQPGMNEGLALTYRSMPMPKHVWVVELTTAALLRGSSPGNRRVIGEIVFDSTADWRANSRSFLAFHLLGRMLTRSPERCLPDGFFQTVDDEEPYPSILWRRLATTTSRAPHQ
jgi:hypothetical protein